MKRISKMLFVLAVLLSSLLSTALYVQGNSSGRTGTTQLNGEGCICHGAPSTAVSVSILGADTVLIGSTNTYTVRITGGPLVRGGTNIAASSGTLNVVAGSGLRKVGNELTHASPKAPVNNAVSFEFTFTAPATAGNVTLFANGNSVNFNSNSAGDQWNFAPNKTVVVTATSSTLMQKRPLGFELAQNFPNPFNPTTTIQFTLPQDDVVRLKVYDAIGQEVQTLVNGRTAKGTHKVHFNAANLSSGVYFYRLETSAYSETKKMLLLK